MGEPPTGLTEPLDLANERLEITEQLADVRAEIAAVNADIRHLRAYKPKGGRTMVADAMERRRLLVAKQSDLEADLAAVKQEIRDRHMPLGLDDPRLEVIHLLQAMADDYELVPVPIAQALRALVDDVDDVSADLRTWASDRREMAT
jgi:hypothetical protein